MGSAQQVLGFACTHQLQHAQSGIKRRLIRLMKVSANKADGFWGPRVLMGCAACFFRRALTMKVPIACCASIRRSSMLVGAYGHSRALEAEVAVAFMASARLSCRTRHHGFTSLSKITLNSSVNCCWHARHHWEQPARAADF